MKAFLKTRTGKLILAFAILCGLLAMAISYRHHILFPLVTSGEPRSFIENPARVPGGTVMGEEGYFVVVQLDAQTYAIAEPQAQTRNFNYLLLGRDRALLFDAGVGYFDISPVVQAITNLPVTFMPSHFHYDHTGQKTDWARVAIIDLPHIRSTARDDVLTLSWEQHLGSGEGIDTLSWKVTDWVAPDGMIALGGRDITVLYTPGHTDNSVSLYDRGSGMVFSGDFIGPAYMNTLTPTARMGDYVQASERVLAATKNATDLAVYAAHGAADGSLPLLSRADVATLREQLLRIRDGTLKGAGSYPVAYQIKGPMVLLAEPKWLHDWGVSYPPETQ